MLKEQDFINAVKGLNTGIWVKDPARTMVIHTGPQGMGFFDDAMKLETLKLTLETLKIEEIKKDNLRTMLNSKDPESVDLAKMMIDQFSAEAETKSILRDILKNYKVKLVDVAKTLMT